MNKFLNKKYCNYVDGKDMRFYKPIFCCFKLEEISKWIWDTPRLLEFPICTVPKLEYWKLEGLKLVKLLMW